MDAQSLNQRLREAVVSLANYRTTAGPKDLRASWPEPIAAFWTAYGADAPRVRRPVPSSEQIDRMDEILAWMAELRRQAMPDEAERVLWCRILWARGAMFSWQAIADQLKSQGLKISGKTIQRRHDVAIACLLRIAQREGQRQAAA